MESAMEQTNVIVMKHKPAPVKTILLAEDDSLVRELVHEYLKDHGYQLIVAESGQAALDASQSYKGRIDLLLSDFQMPNMDGITLSEQISVSRPDTKTLLMSGYTGDSARFSQGTRSKPAFIQKPFMPLDLLDRIEKLIA
jgi:two-component system cell cycle sensor histidine kinase/response regulator CckA